MRHALRALTVAVTLLTTGCMRPYAKPLVLPEDANFVGLLGQVQAETVDLVSVHGMCTHDEEWVNDINGELGEGLSLRVASMAEPETIAGAQLWRSTLANEDGATVVRNFSIVWSPLTTDLKAGLCYDTNVPTKVCDGTGYERSRARLNGTIKSQLLNDCLADALIYAGTHGSVIRDAIRRVLDRIRAERSSPQTPLFLLSESLGSKVIADAVLEAIDRSAPGATERVAGLASLQQIYMAANQIALLELAGIEENAPGLTRSIDRLRRLIEASPSRPASVEEDGERVQLIAFTDPNDLLSYELRGDSDGINVLLSNGPTVFGFLEAPWGAHTSYTANEEFWRIVVCGHGDSATC